MENDLIDGCKDGNITKGFEYAMKVGLVSRKDYPYRSKGGTSFKCRKDIVEDESIKKYKIKGFRALPRDNCEAVQQELAKGNTIAVMMAMENAVELSHFR